jgi:hypothetical protein
LFESAVKEFTVAALSDTNNILTSKIKCNPVFGAKFKGHLFNENAFEHEPHYTDTFDTVLVEDLIINFRIMTKPEIEQMLGVQIGLNTYNILFRSLSELPAVREWAAAGYGAGIARVAAPAPANSTPLKVRTILTKPKKGSRLYRNFLTKIKMPKKPVNLNIFRKFCKLTDTNLLPNPIVKNFNIRWNTFGASNKLREFAFKFCNNILGINSRVSHFNRFVNDACTFCTINGHFPAPRESFKHVFYDCPESQHTIAEFENKYLAALNLHNEEQRTLFWFFGALKRDLTDSRKFFSLTAITVLFYIWDCKLRKCRQSSASCLNFYFYHMDIIRRISPSLRDEMSKIDLDLCRYWNGERPRGW